MKGLCLMKELRLRFADLPDRACKEYLNSPNLLFVSDVKNLNRLIKRFVEKAQKDKTPAEYVLYYCISENIPESLDYNPSKVMPWILKNHQELLGYKISRKCNRHNPISC